MPRYGNKSTSPSRSSFSSEEEESSYYSHSTPSVNSSKVHQRREGRGREKGDARGRGRDESSNSTALRALMKRTSHRILELNECTRAIDQKVSLYNTSRDSRENHELVNETITKGKKLTRYIRTKMKDIHAQVRQYDEKDKSLLQRQENKLMSDFKAQMKQFDQSCQTLLSKERNSVALLRESFNHSIGSGYGPNGTNENGNGSAFGGGLAGGWKNGQLTEEQVLANAEITVYDEEDLNKREDDIIHINHQLKEVNAAYKEIDDLINDQEEVIVEMVDNTQQAEQTVEKANEQVAQADQKTKYCNCSAKKICCFAFLGILIFALVFGLMMGFKH